MPDNMPGKSKLKNEIAKNDESAEKLPELTQKDTKDPKKHSQKYKDQKVKIRVEGIKKIFRVGTQDVDVLKGINFDIYDGDFLVVFGPSGCGKSTLLHTILGLEPPSEGSIIYFGDENIYENKSEDMRSNFRKQHVGMVYQQANWIRALNVRENVAFPLTLLGISKHEAFSKATQALKQLNMDGWAEYVPTELSGGQQQRVSLARALINDPAVIVADEPTGNLDFQSGQDIMNLLQNLNQNEGKTIIMVTHDLEYLKYSTRIVKMFDGAVEGIYDSEEREKVIGSVYSKRGVNVGVNSESDNESSQVESAS